MADFSDAELMSIVCSAVSDFPKTVPNAAAAEPTKTDVRGFLQLVAGGDYRREE